MTDARVWTEEQIRVGLNTSGSLAEKRALVLRAYDETEAALGEQSRALKEAQTVAERAQANAETLRNREANTRVLLQHAKQQMVALMHRDVPS